MAEGVKSSGFVILFLSQGVLTRPFVQFEIEAALNARKKVILVHEQDPRHGPFDFAEEVKKAPSWMEELLANHESLPWQRREFMREAVLDKLSAVAGFPNDSGGDRRDRETLALPGAGLDDPHQAKH